MQETGSCFSCSGCEQSENLRDSVQHNNTSWSVELPAGACRPSVSHTPEKAKVIYLSRMKLDTCRQALSGSVVTSRRCVHASTLLASAACWIVRAQTNKI